MNVDTVHGKDQSHNGDAGDQFSDRYRGTKSGNIPSNGQNMSPFCMPSLHVTNYESTLVSREFLMGGQINKSHMRINF